MSDLLGCSDHNCIYGHPGGMGTNGGCGCEKELQRFGPQGIKAARALRRLRAENEALRNAVQNIGDVALYAVDHVGSGNQTERVLEARSWIRKAHDEAMNDDTDT